MRHSIPGILKRISLAETKNYVELDIYSKEVCTQAVAFTLTPDPEPRSTSIHGSKWEKVTYYGEINDSPLHPLEIFLNQYKGTSERKDMGDLRDSNDDYVSIY